MTVRPIVAVFDRHWGLIGAAFAADISVEQMASLPPEILDRINATVAVQILGSVERALATIGHICMVEWEDHGGPVDKEALTALCRQRQGVRPN